MRREWGGKNINRGRNKRKGFEGGGGGWGGKDRTELWFQGRNQGLRKCGPVGSA